MKDITFRLQGQVITAKLGNKINKEALYGKAKTIVAKDEIVLTKGYLTPAGEILPRGAIDYAKLDPEGTIIEDPLIEIDDQAAILFPSIFDQENELIPVELQELIAFNVSDVYPIGNINLAQGLYRTPPFCYRKSYTPKEAMLLVKDADYAFLLVGERKQTTFVGQQVLYDFFDSETETEVDDELDFAMVY